MIQADGGGRIKILYSVNLVLQQDRGSLTIVI